MRQPFFSFVMPAWKKDFIGEAIKSILNQSFKDFELIVVDDCSPYNLKEVVNNFSDKRLFYYRNKKNVGGQDLAAQWNKCLSYARGKYIILATDDDSYENDFLKTFYRLIQHYPYVNVFRSRIMDINSKGEIISIDRCYKEYLTCGEFLYYYFTGIKGGIPQFIFKREKLEEIGGFVSFDLAWGSDDATALACSGMGLVNSQEMLVKFRWSDVNISSKKGRKTNIRKAKARIELCKWLKKEIVNIKFNSSPLESFCKVHTIENININIKCILLKEFINLNIFDLTRMLYLVKKRNILSLRDILSIYYQYIRKR